MIDLTAEKLKRLRAEFEELYQALKIEAAERGISMAEICEEVKARRIHREALKARAKFRIIGKGKTDEQ